MSAPTLKVYRTWDTGLISRILTDPRIYGRMADGASPPAEKFLPAAPDTGSVVYVAAEVDGTAMGLWGFVPRTTHRWEVHVALLPEMWGETARSASVLAAQWLWSNTTCQCLVAHVPSCSPIVRKFAEDMGMAVCGTLPSAYFKHDRFHDLRILCLNRPANS